MSASNAAALDGDTAMGTGSIMLDRRKLRAGPTAAAASSVPHHPACGSRSAACWTTLRRCTGVRARTTKFCAIVATLRIGKVVMDARMVTQDPPDALGRRVPEGTMSGDKGVEDGV